MGNVVTVEPTFEYMCVAVAALRPSEVLRDVRDGVAYQVYAGGQSGDNQMLGTVIQPDTGISEWFATLDVGAAVHLRWCGPFVTRTGASLFLLGAQLERTMPGTFDKHGERRLLREGKTRVPDPDLPEQRRCELAYRRAVPDRVGEFEIVHIERWRPGDRGGYARALVVTRRDEADYTTHWLYWSHDNHDYPWTLDAGHYGFTTIDRALWDVAIRATHL